MRTMRVLWSTLRLQMKQTFVRPMFQFCMLVNPVLNTVLIYEMFRNSGQADFASYAILGAGLMGLWSCICFSSAGDLNRERYLGTLSLLFAVPASFRTVVWGKVLGNTVLALGTLLISWLTAGLLYGAWILPAEPWYILLALLAVVVCFLFVSVLTAWLLTLSRKTALYMNCIEVPVVLLCGFVVPVEQLPGWAQAAANLLPPTWAVRLLRQTVAAELSGFWRNLGILVLSTAVFAGLARLLYGVIEKQVRVLGNLEVF